MVLREQRLRMTEFLAERLEASGLCTIVERDARHVLVEEKQEGPKRERAYIFAHGGGMTVAQMQERREKNREAGVYSADVFYRDGHTFSVRLGRRALYKARRSLKKYTLEQRAAMIHARDLELDVLGYFGDPLQQLVYYQPKTMLLDESIRVFTMGRVPLDYAHIGEDHRAYKRVIDGTLSLEWRLPIECERVTDGPLYLHLSEPDLRLAWGACSRTINRSERADGAVHAPRVGQLSLAGIAQ